MDKQQIVEDAQKLVEQGLFAEAIDALSKILSANPDLQYAYLVRALAARRAGHMDEALSDYNKFISSDTTDSTAYYGRGFVYIKLGRFDEAIADFSKVIEAQPEEIGAYINRGNAKRKCCRFEDAIKDYESALKLDSMDYHALLGLAQSLDELGETERAINAYTAFLSIENTNVEALFRRGINYAKLAQHSSAARDFSRVLDLDPNHKEAAVNRATAYSQVADNRNVEAAEKKALKAEQPPAPMPALSLTAAIKSLEQYLQASGSISAFVRHARSDQYSMFVVEYLSQGSRAGYVTYTTDGAWFPPSRRAGEGDVRATVDDALELIAKHGNIILKTIWLPGNEKLLPSVRELWSRCLNMSNDASSFSLKEKDIFALRKDLLKQASLASLNKEKPVQPHRFQFRDTDLRDVIFQGLNVSQLKFDKSDMTNASFVEAVAVHTTFENSILRNADFSKVNAEDAYFLQADMQNFVSVKGSFKNANFRNANLKGATFDKANLQGANFVDAALDECSFKACPVNEKTTLPDKVGGYPGVVWKGMGRNPYSTEGRGRVGKDCANLEDLLTSMQMDFDSNRLKKATTMLKANPLQLFVELQENSVQGILKSETDESLTYLCYINNTGTYGCFTQNMNVCGGQTESICKHLFVILIGLASVGELSWSDVAVWTQTASRNGPYYCDENAMAALFKRFKQAEFGQVAWEPIETNPVNY